MSKRLLAFALIVALFLLAACGAVSSSPFRASPGTFSTNPGVAGSGLNLTAGSDADYQHNGGQQFMLAATCADNDTQCALTTDRLTQTLKIMLVRLDAGADHITDAYFKTQPTADNSTVHIAVHIPGKHDAAPLMDILTQPGIIQFIDSGDKPLAVGSQIAPKSYPALFTNADLDPNSIGVTIDPTDGPEVTFAMTGSARVRFATYTQQHIAQYLTIVLDNVVVESAVIQSEITGQGVISGSLTQQDAQRIATLLKAEPLPLAVQATS